MECQSSTLTVRRVRTEVETALASARTDAFPQLYLDGRPRLVEDRAVVGDGWGVEDGHEGAG